MRTWIAALVVASFLLPATAGAEDKVPKADWDAMMKVYAGRAKLEEHKKAAALVADLADKVPGDREAQLFCARTAYYCAHRLEGKEQKATALRGYACAQRLVKANPKDYDGRYMSAMTLFKSKVADGIQSALKESKNVKAYLESMLKDDPNRYEAYMLLGALYRDLPGVISWGDPKKSVELLEKGAALAPKDPEILLELAQSYAKVGRTEDARKTYQKCIDEGEGRKDLDWETQDAKDYARKMLKDL
jgi:tetratricopeptide (TPR) repeat protein